MIESHKVKGLKSKLSPKECNRPRHNSPVMSSSSFELYCETDPKP